MDQPDPKFAIHHEPMVSPDFDADRIPSNEEPFWSVSCPSGSGPGAFLLDRAGMYVLIEQCQKALADYYAKFPLSQDEVDVDQMRPGRPKARPPLRSPNAV